MAKQEGRYARSGARVPKGRQGSGPRPARGRPSKVAGQKAFGVEADVLLVRQLGVELAGEGD